MRLNGVARGWQEVGRRADPGEPVGGSTTSRLLYKMGSSVCNDDDAVADDINDAN